MKPSAQSCLHPYQLQVLELFRRDAGTRSAILRAAQTSAPRAVLSLVELGTGRARLVARLPWWSKLLGTGRVRRRLEAAIAEARRVSVEVEIVVL